jgi:hypothetical protein
VSTGEPSGALRAEVAYIARWDLDKTYLRTDFDTLRDLVRTAIERPDRKRSVPGAAALLRELGRSGARLHILSGSPRQMRGRLEEKLAIDRVRFDELTLKPNLSNIVRGRFRALRDQLGYKLPFMLAARARDQRLGGEDGLVREVLVGDDAEADAFVYSLYADLCSGKADRALLVRVLDAGRVYRDQAERALEAFASIEQGPVVERVLIHLDRQSPPSRFDGFGRRVVPFYNYLQAAFVLAEDGRLDSGAVLRVASELVQRDRFDAEGLARSYLDLMRRGHVHGSLCDALGEALESARREGKVATLEELVKMCELVEGYARNPPERREPQVETFDYLELARRHRGGKNRKLLAFR